MQGTQLLEDGCIAQFRRESIKDTLASLTLEEGRELYPKTPESTFKGVPTFKETVFVEIRVPGNKDEIIDTEAWLDAEHPRSHINRFPQAWQRFQAKEAAGPQGFPLTEWAQVTKAQADNLAWLNVKTVEQLAAVSDDLASRIMGGYDLKRKALGFLEQRAGKDSMREELDALKAQLAALTKSQPSAPHIRSVPEAAASVVANALGVPMGEPAPSLESAGELPAAPKRRGRPKKSEAAAT